jgi:hypothetical protein
MPSLLDDLAKTTLSASLTAGAHAVKGASLGLLDPTPDVAAALGEEVYEAPPAWAKAGAEIAGSFVPVTGALKAARVAIPGVGMVPKVLQGFTAGAGLGAARGLIEGESMEDILKGSLLEGAVFGGLEGLMGVPALVRKHRLKDLQRLWAKHRVTSSEVPTLNPRNISSKSLADEGMDSAMDMFQDVASGGAAKDLPGAIKLSQEFFQNPDMLLYFKLMGEDVTVQTTERLISGKLDSWTADQVKLRLADGTSEVFDMAKFKTRRGAQQLRMFRGNPETHQFPRNSAWELLKSKDSVRRMEGYLYRQGVMRKSDLNKLRGYVNPRVKTIAGWTEHELHTYSSYLQKLKAGEVLPEQITEQMLIYGPAETNVRVGFLTTLQPARWMFEKLGQKIPWMMHEFFDPALKAVANRNFHQVKLMDRVRKISEGLNRNQLKKIYELDAKIAKQLKVAVSDPKYLQARIDLMDDLYKPVVKEMGASTAARLRKAHEDFRQMFDEMFNELVKLGVLPKKRYIKEYWPLLRDESVISFLFGGTKTPLVPELPKHVKGFMEHVRKGLIENPQTDILKLSQIYISTFTKLKHLRPEVSKMYKTFKDFKVKSDVRDIMKHYMARQMGIPSVMDHRLAGTLAHLGSYMPVVGKIFKNMSTKGMVQMAGFLNNLPYYAHMGLRPFAAARNLLQPMITTGPMIGNRWLIHGYRKLLSGKNRQYIKDIKGLQESLGEYSRRTLIRPGKLDKFGNGLMWMFRKSDEMNRMVSGLGMAAKFDHFYTKLGMTEEFFTKIKLRRFRPSVRKTIRDKAKVYRALDEMYRFKYKKGSPAYSRVNKIIKEFSHGEKYVTPGDVVKDIRDSIAKEAIGDTQWLYGKEQSPLFGYRAGVPGRMAMTYQTWWLNYLEFTKNLGRLAKGRDYVPLATAMANNLVLLFAVTQVLDWSVQKGLRTIALGPFTGKVPFVEGEAPPQIDPFIKMLGGIRAALGGDIDGMEKRFETALKKAWDNFIPGSLVYKELARIGEVPQLKPFGQRLTPKASKQYATPAEKLQSVFGGGR